MTQSNRNLFLILGAIVLAAALGTVVLMAGGKSDAISTAPASAPFSPIPAPDFELELFSGKTIKLSDFKGKKPVILNFWASWCGPCREEAPLLTKVGKEYADEVEFIGIVVNDSQKNAQAFIDEFGVPYVNGHDTSGIGPAYRVTGIPETFWIDKDGQIIDRWIGAIDEANLISRTKRLIED